MLGRGEGRRERNEVGEVDRNFVCYERDFGFYFKDNRKIIILCSICMGSFVNVCV